MVSRRIEIERKIQLIQRALHRFFNAFGPILQPNVCVLLDVGTQPGPSSIYRLWKAFDINSNVAGACGCASISLSSKYGLQRADGWMDGTARSSHSRANTLRI